MARVHAEPLAGLRRLWSDAQSYQRFLYIVGLLLIGSGVFHTGVFLVSGGTLDGDVSWRKPILFAEAFGITSISIAWFLTFLPRNPKAGWWIAAPLGIANTGEVLWVTVQQWRGVPSHFNDASVLDEALFAGAGVLILFTTAAIVAVTIRSFRSMSGPPSLRLTIQAGLVLLLVGLGFGLIMIVNEANTIGAAGALKVPHAVAIHAAQVLPLLGFGLRYMRVTETERLRIASAGVVAYAAFVGATGYQALSGLALSDASIGGGSLLMVTVTACGVAMYRMWRSAAAELAPIEPAS